MNMQTIMQQLEQMFNQAFAKLELQNYPIMLTESTQPQFGDYQVNGVMSIAKALKLNPRELAQQVCHVVENDQASQEIIQSIQVAGPGFINIIIKNNFLENYIKESTSANNFGIDATLYQDQTLVIDYSSPNLAKEMHVGHLRSTVIGDALSRVFEYVGYKVIRQNHVGDFGTQFGMLMAFILQQLSSLSNGTLPEFSINDLEDLYRDAKAKFDTDEEFAKLSRECVVALQAPESLPTNNNLTTLNALLKGSLYLIQTYWQKFREESLKHCQEVYNALDIELDTTNDEVTRGESFYKDQLIKIVEKLKNLKHNDGTSLVVESEGATCIFIKDEEVAEDAASSTPFIIKKQDGGYLYATTDLAAIDYRINELKANRLIYVVDVRQSLHFKQLFAIAKKLCPAHFNIQFEHIAFGTMMNESGKPFKTREGSTVKLIDLINLATSHAKEIMIKRNPEWPIDKNEHLSRVLAVAAIKYADLSKNRLNDYIFNIDKMLAFEGNTASYLIYAYTRIKSILTKASFDSRVNMQELDNYKPNIISPVERSLILHLVKFADTILQVARECYPNYLCNYLYNLACLFMQFYEACPVLKVEDDAQMLSRLALVEKTARILKTGLWLLGIKVVEKM